MATKKATSTTKKKVAVKKTVTKATVASTGSVTSTLRDFSFWRTLAAELLGTFLLASAIIIGRGDPIIILFALVAIVLLVGTVSGAHLNPAITIGAWVTRRISSIKALGYIVAQCLGAALAFVTLTAFLGAAAPVSPEAVMYGATAPALFSALDLTDGKEWFILFAELLGTTVLGFAIASALRARNVLTAAFTAGLGIFVALLLAGTAAGYAGSTAIINPAVAISLQAIEWNWSIFIYIIAPAIGGVLGFGLHDLIKGRR